ncbi:hypothetical protein VKS41_001171 [Umbelopsis sp. WA50703]
MTVDSNSAKGADQSPPATEDTPLLNASPTTQVNEYEESLVFSLIFVLPSAVLFVISFIACVIPSSWAAYSFVTRYWHYPGSLPLTCWLLLYPIVWSLPPTINVLAWHGIFRSPLTLPEAHPKIPSTRVGRQLLAWSVPRALLYLNIIFLISIALTILFTSELRRFDWLAALAAIWGAFVLTWVSSQINFYARRRIKRLLEISEMSDEEDEDEDEQESTGDVQDETAGSTAQKRSRTNSSASSGRIEALSAASQPAAKPKMIARIPSNHSRLLPARIPLYRLTTESTLYLTSFIATLLLLNVIFRARESLLYPPPGERFTTKDGTSLHVECQGTNSFGEKNITVPTILFEPGASVLASHHVAFLTELEQAGQVGRYCWYDRAGYGWSSSGVLPATAEAEADQAYEVIVQKMHEESLIIVGHSFGGMIARMFAAKYPQHVVGLVLLDASHEDELYWTEVHGKEGQSLSWAIRKWQWSCVVYDFVWLILEPLGVDRWIPIWSIGDEGWKAYGEKTRAGLLNGRALQAISSEVRNLVTLSADQVRSTRPAPFIDYTDSASTPTVAEIFPPDLPVSVVTSGELGCQLKECQDDEEDSKKAWTELQRDLAFNLSLVHEWTIAPSSSHIIWRDEEGASTVKEAIVKMFRSSFV